MEDVADLVEAVHIQLSDEGGDVGVFEVRGQNLGELGRGRHDEAFVRVGPGDEMLNSLVFEHAVQLVDEGSLHDLWVLGCGGRTNGRRIGLFVRRVAGIWLMAIGGGAAIGVIVLVARTMR